MIFSCGLTFKERLRRRDAEVAALKKWHRWFAWKPVHVYTNVSDDLMGIQKCAWLQYVSRRGKRVRRWVEPLLWEWEYRL